MTVILEESEDISPELLSCLLDSVKNDNKVQYCCNPFSVCWLYYFLMFLVFVLRTSCPLLAGLQKE